MMIALTSISMAGGLALFIVLLVGEAPRLAVGASAAILALAMYLSLRRSLGSLYESLVEDVKERVIGELSEYSEDDVDPFIVANAVSTILSYITSFAPKTRVVIHSDGEVIEVYPDHGDEGGEAIDGVELKDLDAAMRGDEVVVALSYEAAATITRMCHETQGEGIKVGSRDELELLYSVAKALAKAVNQGAPKELVSYAAYKAIIKMYFDGVLDAPSSLIKEAPPEPATLKSKLRRQVAEELGLKWR